MSAKDKTIPKVFILESLDFEDESNGHFEGEIIYNILRMSTVECEYYYYRTKMELGFFLQRFKESNFRYLHLSFHANHEGVYTTMDEFISIKDLAFMLENFLDNRRLFLSACSLTTDNLANEIFGNTDCYSIMGANEDISMNDAAVFWSSFYHLMFNREKTFIKHEDLKTILYKLRKSFEIPLRYYRRASSTKQGWKRITLKD